MGRTSASSNDSFTCTIWSWKLPYQIHRSPWIGWSNSICCKQLPWYLILPAQSIDTNSNRCAHTRWHICRGFMQKRTKRKNNTTIGLLNEKEIKNQDKQIVQAEERAKSTRRQPSERQTFYQIFCWGCTMDLHTIDVNCSTIIQALHKTDWLYSCISSSTNWGNQNTIGNQDSR